MNLANKKEIIKKYGIIVQPEEKIKKVLNCAMFEEVETLSLTESQRFRISFYPHTYNSYVLLEFNHGKYRMILEEYDYKEHSTIFIVQLPSKKIFASEEIYCSCPVYSMMLKTFLNI